MHLSLIRKLIYPFIFLFLAISWFEISFSKKLNSETLDSEDINTFIQKAEEGVDIFIEPKQGTALFYLNQGINKTNYGDHKGAIIDFNDSIRLNPSDPSAYYNRGLAKKRLKNISGAIQDYDQAIYLLSLIHISEPTRR